MRRLRQLAERFARDEGGAFLALFGVIAITLVALSGAAYDFVAIEQARGRAQAALDTAALSMQPLIYTDTNEEIRQKAEALLAEQIGDSRVTVAMDSVVTDPDDGTLALTAHIEVPMTFVSLVGVQEINAQVFSEATRKKLFMEVAMVLDNSGSMAQFSRMTNLKAAAKNAADILFDYEDTSDSTYISVVPFNFWVNIGADKRNALWMDQDSSVGFARDNFSDDDEDNELFPAEDADTDATPFTAPFSRFDLYDNFSNASDSDVTWRGCVESRVYPYDVQDTPPNAGNPDTLFVPQFAPDEPDAGNYENSYVDDDTLNCFAELPRACHRTSVRHGCDQWGNNCDHTTDAYVATYPDGNVVSSGTACSCLNEIVLSDTGWSTPVSEGSGNYSRTRVRTCNDYYSVAAGLSARELQERLCKYEGADADADSDTGPNSGCVSTPLLALNNNRTTIKARIDAMRADGYTNIHQGAIWGFHALSPGVPFTEGRDYDTATYKVMILMTDGANTYYTNSGINGSTRYSPYGHLANGRIGSMTNTAAEIEDLVDQRLLETCTNAKAAGIDIYTIGLAPPNQGTRDMLTACANGAAKAFFPANATELNDVFETIALQLADLRLSQ